MFDLRYLYSLVCIPGFLAAPLAAQTPTPTEAKAERPLTLSGSVRLRYETIDGQPRAGFNSSDDLFNIRTILTGEYDAGPVRVGAELYDSRAYGANAGTPLSTNEVNALELVQAYIATDIDAPFGQGTKASLQAGRFTLNLGSRRLVAADDYRNTTNGNSGLRADIDAGGGLAGTFIYVLPQVRLPDDGASLRDNDLHWDRESFDLVLWGGTVMKKKALGKTNAELSFYHLGERDAPGRPTRNRSLDTVSARIIRDPAERQWDYELEGVYQTGSVRSGLAVAAPSLDASAAFVHADIGYSPGGAWKPRVSAEFDYASGDKGTGSFNRFDTLFGMRRADLAPAGLYNAVGRGNILTPAIRIEATLNKRLDWFANYRAMWLASRTDSFSTTAVRDVTGQSGRFAGHQIEARVRYWLIPQRLRFETNGVWLIKGRFLKAAPNGQANGDTRYLSFNVTASF